MKLFLFVLAVCLKKERGCVEDQPQPVANSSWRREFVACYGWSKTTQPRSRKFRQALILAGLILRITTSAFGQTNSTGTAAIVPAPTGSENSISISNPAPDIRAMAQQAEQMRALCVNGRRRICGQVLQVTPGGLVVDSGYTDLLRPELSQSWVAPGTVTTSRPANLVEENTPGSPCIGLVFLADIPKRPAVKIYDYVIIEAYPTGEYIYQPVPGVTKNIRRFSARLEGAVQWNLGVGRK